MFRLANHRSFRAEHKHKIRYATILGAGPKPNTFVGFYDGSEILHEFPADVDEWVNLVKFLES